MEFRAPGQKTFIVVSERGSGIIRHKALNPLISSEIEAAAGKAHHDSSIAAANYSLDLLGEQQVGPYHCFVAQAVPRRQDRYLFEGKLWIDVDDYAVVRIEGHPARRLSFWIQRADFVRQYQKIDGFWLPQKDQTFVRVRLYGKKILTIAHQDYVVNGTQNKREGRPLVQEARALAGVDGNYRQSSVFAEHCFIYEAAGFSLNESRGVVVLQNCANPGCGAQFRYLHEGKLFEIEIQYFDSPSANDQGKLANGKGQIERCWLCDECAAYIALRFDRQRGVVMVSSFGDSDEKPVILHSNGRAAAEIERVLIRPLDLDLSVRRKATSESKVRMREIA